ncbi:Sua5/YciO/YrdC/YwlC family protein [Aquirufa antheringensis]|uniref:L-threonylcarbamoyladenylate synthase n=3 Tax=Aquirufa antheringensis TaxID=2516559 RepID=A0A4Q9B860_9BACT|nr:Sua5/YciO/YrdC/YwlC family protein [Aquirufa antheringensis]MCZ2486547.1 Sua5/YciO/YrdC/YwlC family protein [Aquirufa antheringensis]MCZ2488672.1 Sua5/YciO/YrdC/YwlC family protein [Aquirufa antheringensis]TBH71106.1 Sua5/YciO/YrdC/YwlC family protein [Aquirufa antheringensis]
MMQNMYHEAIQTLKSGGVLLYPSDTIWGLGCDVRNEQAIEKILELKNRPASKGLIVLISKIEQLSEYVEQVPDLAWDLVEFAEDPLTIIYPKGKNVSPSLLAPDGSIAIRLVKDEFCKGLIYRYQRAIVSTSANLSGEPSPLNFAGIAPSIVTGVDGVLKNPAVEGPAKKASKIVQLGLHGDYKLIRG